MSSLPTLQAKDLACDGVLPSGPVCPWPKLDGIEIKTHKSITTLDPKNPIPVKHDTVIKASVADMAKGLFRNTKAVVSNGKVSEEIRNERYDTCKLCPHFIEASKRCSECGCFMELKTWVNENPKLLCPKQKWSR